MYWPAPPLLEPMECDVVAEIRRGESDLRHSGWREKRIAGSFPDDSHPGLPRDEGSRSITGKQQSPIAGVGALRGRLWQTGNNASRSDGQLRWVTSNATVSTRSMISVLLRGLGWRATQLVDGAGSSRSKLPVGFRVKVRCSGGGVRSGDLIRAFRRSVMREQHCPKEPQTDWRLPSTDSDGCLTSLSQTEPRLSDWHMPQNLSEGNPSTDVDQSTSPAWHNQGQTRHWNQSSLMGEPPALYKTKQQQVDQSGTERDRRREGSGPGLMIRQPPRRLRGDKPSTNVD